jgi:hypothetical protein
MKIPIALVLVTGLSCVRVQAQTLAEASEAAKQMHHDWPVSSNTGAPRVYTNANLPAAAVGHGIQPLTLETMATIQAEALRPPADVVLPTGRHVMVSPTPLNFPLSIRMRGLTRTSPPSAGDLRQSHEILNEVHSMPFSFSIMTPYSVVTLLAQDAARKSIAPQLPSLAALNAGLVTVRVSPGTEMDADVINSVVIRRGGETIHPLKSTVTPTTVSNLLGASKASAEGAFTFPFDTFAPDVPVTLVMIGRAGNHEWTMSPDELRQLK